MMLFQASFVIMLLSFIPPARSQNNSFVKYVHSHYMGSLERKESIGNNARPVIYDTDYGPFIDDVFALGLLANSRDLLDLKYVLATGENPSLSAQCAGKHLNLAGFGDIPIGVGSKFPDYSLRGGVCAVPGLLGFALEEKCNEGLKMNVDEDGIASISSMLIESNRHDWIFIVVGGQSSIKALAQNYPKAVEHISILIVMGGNWCSGYQPYPDIDAPTDETNIGCDPAAANFILDRNVSPFKKIYYVPVEVADEIGGEDYMKIVEAANSGANLGAAATIDFYRSWSTAARANEDILVHAEALAFNPEIESTPQFDACAVMLALELADEESCNNRLSLFDFHATHFAEVGDDGLQNFPEAPRAAFSLVAEGFAIEDTKLPEECPSLTAFSFNPSDTPEDEMPVTVALGFSSRKAKSSFYTEMAERIAGIFGSTTGINLCFERNEQRNDTEICGKQHEQIGETKSLDIL